MPAKTPTTAPISIASALGHETADKRIEILRLIRKTGSISQAAREAHISYKAAWQAIHTLTNLAGVNLVERLVGGVGGGGARLTRHGIQLLEAADLLDNTRHEVLKQLQGQDSGRVGEAITRLSIRTSMRNHVPCHVQELDWRGQVVRVLLRLPSGDIMASRITRDSAELLALEPGLSVLALCKATAVEIGKRSDFSETPGINLLRGSAARICRGDGEDEIFIELSPDLQLVGFAPAEKAIRTRSRIVAAIDESAVVIALVE